MERVTEGGLIEIRDINLGGLSASKWSGVKNSVYKLTGWDLHSQPGIMRVAQKLTKDSGTTVTEFCKCAVSSTNGIQYYFSADSGKIWQNKAGTYTLVYTVAPAAGEAKILGAFEYQGYIYFATQSRLHRIASASADGSSNWTANVVANWATFTVTDSSFHPMVEQNLVLYIGDGNYLAQVDAGVFSANALDIKTPLRIKSLGKIDTDVLLGTYTSDNVTKSQIIRWNTWSVSFTNIDEIEEVGINAFLQADNFVYVQAGLAGNIYSYDGYKLSLFKKIPGDYSPTAEALVHPNAVANLNGRILFGVSNDTGNPCDQGVYQIGRNSEIYPYIMDMPYPISERSGGALVTSGIEIGAILAVGTNLYVTWKNSTAYGVDKLDYSNKLEVASLETTVKVINRESFANFSKFIVPYASLPASTGITIQYSKNYGDYISTTEVTDSQRCIVYAEEGVEANTLQLKITPTVSSNSAPEIESIGITIS